MKLNTPEDRALGLVTIIIVAIVGWLLGSWFFMILLGVIHADVLHAVIPVSYWTSMLVLFLARASLARGRVSK